MTTDMFPHWNYVIEGIIGRIKTVYSQTVTHIPQRVDENGATYACTADDAAYAIFQVETPEGDEVLVELNSSWNVRVHRGELVEFQVDGTQGTAVAGLRQCLTQSRAETPTPTWNPDLPDPNDYLSQWTDVSDTSLQNGFKLQWEEFLADVVAAAIHCLSNFARFATHNRYTDANSPASRTAKVLMDFLLRILEVALMQPRGRANNVSYI